VPRLPADNRCHDRADPAAISTSARRSPMLAGQRVTAPDGTT